MIKLYRKTVQPFESLYDAVDAAKHEPGTKKTIVLPDGDYFLDRPLLIDQKNSGLTIKSKNPHGARLYGGKKITGWRPKTATLWSASIPETASGMWDFRMLIVNSQMAARSRLPETGYYFHDSEFDVRWQSTVEGGWERPATDDELLTLKYRPEDIGPWFDPNNAELTIYHMWDESLVGVADFDPARNIIKFADEPGYPPGAFAKQYNMNRRYVIWNLFQGLKKPGQWYLDRSAGKVIYWPRPGEDMATATVLAPVMDTIIKVSGKSSSPAQNITLEGLDISVSNAPRMTGAFGAKLFDGAIQLENAKACELKNLHIHNVAGHAIKSDCDQLTIEDSEIDFTGASAVRSVGADIRIYNNYIHHVGQIFPSAIAVYVGMTDPNVPDEWNVRQQTHHAQIIHNELHDTPYTAIACGGNHHLVESNLIYRAMQNLYDGAGIYTTFCENVIIRGNYVHDIKKSAGAGTSAYYMDEKTVNSLLEFNVCTDVARPMHNHISNGNIIRNNIFLMPDGGYYTLERCRDYIFEHNILISAQDFELFGIQALKKYHNNIFYCRSGKPLAHELQMYIVKITYPLPLNAENIIADPKVQFMDGAVTFSTDSPAALLGIQPVDVSLAGRIPEDQPDNCNTQPDSREAVISFDDLDGKGTE